MHPSAMNFLREHCLVEEFSGARVLEVGSFNVNGSPREVIEAFEPAQYIGVDMRLGPGVDERLNASELIPRFRETEFDIVVSTEMLEHCEDWRLAVANMKALVRPGGLLFITTRSSGFPYHPEVTQEGAYGDYWRYSIEDMEKMFADWQTLVLLRDPDHSGVFYKGRRPVTPYEPVNLTRIEVSKV